MKGVWWSLSLCSGVIWSSSYIQYIETIEQVQRKFTKRLPGFKRLSFMERLHLLGLPSIELCRLHIDFGTTNIVWTCVYK